MSARPEFLYAPKTGQSKRLHTATLEHKGVELQVTYWNANDYSTSADYQPECHIVSVTVGNGASALVKQALQKCIQSFEDLGEDMPVYAGCLHCTAGTTPNHLNTGLCGYHAAQAALSMLGCDAVDVSRLVDIDALEYELDQQLAGKV